MRRGWVYLYESPPAPIRFEELVDQLRHNGISLADPGTGRVIRLSTTGEQILSSREDIIGELANATEVSFNLYFAPSDNVFCSIRKLNDETLREGYSLDGKTEEESQHIIENLTRLFCKRAENGAAFGFVVDKYAELHREFHWDDFFLWDTNSPPEWPMLIGCSVAFHKLSNIPAQLYIRETVGNCILFRGTG